MAARDAQGLWPFAAAFVLAVVGVCVAVFWPDPPSSLRVANPNENAAGGSFAVRLRTPYRLLTYPLCVAHGTVTIQKVVPHRPTGDIRIVDWAVADRLPNGAEDSDPGLAKSFPGFSQAPISKPCSKPQAFAVSIELTRGRIGTADGFEVHSTSGTVVVPFTTAICATGVKCPDPPDYSGTP